MKPFAVWITGLPGCGKSTVAALVAEALARRGIAVRVHAMDARRKIYHPAPSYTSEERAEAYRIFVDEAVELVESGEKLILDAAAPSLEPRRLARKKVTAAGGRFAEVWLRCSLEIAMEREAARPEGAVRARLYAQALERKRTGKDFPGLGAVPGVDVPYQENPDAELMLDANALPPEQLANQILAFLEGWLPS